MKGVPCRIEIGPRDLENGVATLVRRDTGEKTTAPLDTLTQTVPELLDKIHQGMYDRAAAFMQSHIREVSSLEELGDAVNHSCFALADWCGDRACEDRIKETFQASSRNMPFDQSGLGEKCVCCGRKAKHKIYFGKAY